MAVELVDPHDYQGSTIPFNWIFQYHCTRLNSKIFSALQREDLATATSKEAGACNNVVLGFCMDLGGIRTVTEDDWLKDTECYGLAISLHVEEPEPHWGCLLCL
jgi:hypothetical protein